MTGKPTMAAGSCVSIDCEQARAEALAAESPGAIEGLVNLDVARDFLVGQRPEIGPG